MEIFLFIVNIQTLSDYLKGTIQYDVNYMRRPGQRAVLRPKNGQQVDHRMMTETATGSKLKSSLLKVIELSDYIILQQLHNAVHIIINLMSVIICMC